MATGSVRNEMQALPNAAMDLPPIDEVPAAHLAGRQLPNGWTVGELVTRPDGATGGHFSLSYWVHHESGQKAFLKALNFSEALRSKGNVADRMRQFVTEYTYERDLLLHCRDRKLSRIVRLLDDGEVSVPEAGLLGTIPYLIFELAEGDLRAHQARLDAFDVAWVLRALAHATTGIEQLHRQNTAHQDLKPSNVLTQSAGQEMKLGDLGRAERRDLPGPFTDLTVAGAISYAPPEQLYGAFGHTWEERRAADLYHLGSLGVQLFLQHNLTSLLLRSMPKELHPRFWSGGDYADVLPALQHAHGTVLGELENAVLTLTGQRDLTEDFVRAVREMTDSDPARRGHPKDRRARTSSFSVRRYVSVFNRLASQTRSAMLRPRSK